MNMLKQITTGLLILSAGYSMSALAGAVVPPPPPPPVVPSGNIGSGAFGTDNFTLNSNIGSNPGAAGRGPGSLAYSLNKIFFGSVELHFNADGVLVDPSGKPFTGTTVTGEVFKDGKKQ
jgi:hypothetical protein